MELHEGNEKDEDADIILEEYHDNDKNVNSRCLF